MNHTVDQLVVVHFLQNSLGRNEIKKLNQIENVPDMLQSSNLGIIEWYYSESSKVVIVRGNPGVTSDQPLPLPSKTLTLHQG